MDIHGYVRITDRKKDMILVSGFNVYPNEVESVVAAQFPASPNARQSAYRMNIPARRYACWSCKDREMDARTCWPIAAPS